MYLIVFVNEIGCQIRISPYKVFILCVRRRYIEVDQHKAFAFIPNNILRFYVAVHYRFFFALHFYQRVQHIFAQLQHFVQRKFGIGLCIIA